MAANYLE